MSFGMLRIIQPVSYAYNKEVFLITDASLDDLCTMIATRDFATKNSGGKLQIQQECITNNCYIIAGMICEPRLLC